MRLLVILAWILGTVAAAANLASGATRHTLTSPQTLDNQSLALADNEIGVAVNGSGHIIRDLRTIGGYQTILFNGDTSNVIVDGLRVTDPADKGYGIYLSSGGKASPNRGLLIRDIEIIIGQGKWGGHCVRGYATEGLIAVDWTLKHSGKFPGHPLNFRQGKDSAFINLRTEGRCNQLGPDKKDGELDYRVSGLTFIGGVFDANGGWLSTDANASPCWVFWSGTSDVTFIGSTFIQRNPKKALLRCEASWKTRPAATGLRMIGCTFSGGNKLVDGGNPGGVMFIGGTRDGVAIGVKGE